MEMSIPMMKKRRMTISEDIFEKKKLDEESVYTVLGVSTMTSVLDGWTTMKIRI